MRDHKPICVENLLAHVPLFSGLEPTELARVAQSTREIHADKGDILFRRGDPCAGFHLLVYGQVKLSFTSERGTEKVVEIVRDGQSFGEAVLFLDKPYFVTAQTLSDSLVLHVPKAVIFSELETDHRFSHRMLAGMAMRLHQLVTDVEAYSLQSGKQRVIGYLVGELPDNQLAARDVVLDLQVSKGVIASRLNLTQEHFSRILHELTDLGLISVAARRIQIPDVAALARHQY